jgi:hypothetical protein
MALPALFAVIMCQPDELVLNGLLPSFKDITHRDDYDATVADIALGLGVDYDIPDIMEALRGRGVVLKV